ncbi:MAG TPA: sugar phosphate isomerase/epimerase [Mycobacterium sp.]
MNSAAEVPLVLANLTTVATGSFRERVEVAREAGYQGLGIGLDTCRRVTSSEMPAHAMKSVLDDNGMRIVELEVILGFAVDPAQAGVPFGGGFSYTSEEDLAEFLRMAEIFGSTHIQAAGAFTEQLEPDVVERFAGLCDRAADSGLNVAIEFCAPSNIPDAAVAAEILTAADRPNGGACIDIWHHTRGANNLGLLAKIPSDKVFMVQLNDGGPEPVDPDFFTETLRFRRVPGAGAFDTLGFLQTLDASLDTASVSVEVMSEELGGREPLAAARATVQAARSVLAHARSAPCGLAAPPVQDTAAGDRRRQCG